MLGYAGKTDSSRLNSSHRNYRRPARETIQHIKFGISCAEKFPWIPSSLKFMGIRTEQALGSGRRVVPHPASYISEHDIETFAEERPSHNVSVQVSIFFERLFPIKKKPAGRAIR